MCSGKGNVMPVSDFDKEKSCQGCPDRVIEPNCHDDCDGYKWRIEQNEKRKAARRAEAEILGAACDAVKRSKRLDSSLRMMRYKKK